MLSWDKSPESAEPCSNHGRSFWIGKNDRLILPEKFSAKMAVIFISIGHYCFRAIDFSLVFVKYNGYFGDIKMTVWKNHICPKRHLIK